MSSTCSACPKSRAYSIRHSPPVSARIRLAAAFGLLKLLTSSEPAYLKAIIEPSRFEALSRLCQDTTFEVRDAFLRKTVAYLRAGRFVAAVTARLNMILFLVAHEPEDELKELVFSFARARRRLPEGALGPVAESALWQWLMVACLQLSGNPAGSSPSLA